MNYCHGAALKSDLRSELCNPIIFEPQILALRDLSFKGKSDAAVSDKGLGPPNVSIMLRIGHSSFSRNDIAIEVSVLRCCLFEAMGRKEPLEADVVGCLRLIL